MTRSPRGRKPLGRGGPNGAALLCCTASGADGRLAGLQLADDL